MQTIAMREEEQMHQQPPDSTGRYGAPRPDDDQWDEDDQWGTVGWPQRGPAPQFWAAAPHSGNRGGSGRGPHIQPVTAAVIAVIVMAAAFAITLILVKGSSSTPSASTVPGNAPAGGAPAQGGGGGALGGGGTGQLFMSGKVTNISSTSITLSAQEHVITAAITSSTQFTGSVKNASGIKADDAVTVTISGYGSSHPVANSISDPAQIP